MKKSLFSFYISKAKAHISEMPREQKLNDYIIYTDSYTPLDICEREDRICAVFGYAADLKARKTERIAEQILTNSSSLQDVIDAEYHLGGKYFLLYKDASGCFICGDATCSVPIYYTTFQHEFICTSNLMLIVREQNLSPDATLQHIRNSGNISQAMPFDLTEYKEIKQLIPNHYLALNDQSTHRFVNSANKQRKLTVQEATEKAKPLIEFLTRYYIDKFDVYCPITSGRDSRVVLSFLSRLTSKPINSYTIKHVEHSGSEQDLVIPPQLARVCGMNHRQIEDVPADIETQQLFDEYLGRNRYSKRTLNIANTIHSYFAEGAVINGDIIGQVGKCSLHRDIPHILATPEYFRWKLHNYSREARYALNSWIKEIRAAGECVNLFDLFSIENRMGRWAAQENTIYSAKGQLYLNIFNSRSIIYLWTSVRRSERKKSLLHIALIKETCPVLLSVPFEKDTSTIIKLSKANGLFYYITSFLKYRIERRRFMKEKK